jgi:hypothetical protein
MRASAILLLMLLGAVLTACAAAKAATGQPASPAAVNTQAATSSTTVLPVMTAPATGGWLSHNELRGGYSVQYPPDWTVTESTGAGGEIITTFTAPGGGSKIAVSVLSGGGAAQGPQDMPNTRCQPVTISGAVARRCFDTIAGAYSTTLSTNNRQYTIATSGHFLDQTLYQRFLDSFTLNP